MDILKLFLITLQLIYLVIIALEVRITVVEDVLAGTIDKSNGFFFENDDCTFQRE
jgi:hypothetical protein